MRTLIENRTLLSLALSCSIGIVLYRRLPSPDEHPLLGLVLVHKPYIFWAIRNAYVAMLFTTPLIGVSMFFSLLYIFVVRQQQNVAGNRLPSYPDPRLRQSLFLVIGELHNLKRPEPAERPQWLTIPDRGLYTGIAVFGAIGSGKTSCCMYPFAEQIFAYRSADPERRASALVLEVNGDFCYKVAALPKKLGREADYVEVGLEGRYRYNPLHNDLEAYALAYGIASLLNNLFGKGKEPFWQQAYTNLVKFIILLHKVNYDYGTLFDVSECAINPEVLESRIREGERLFETEEYVLVSETDYVELRDLAEFPFEKDPPTNEMKAPVSADLLRHLDANRIPYSLLAATAPDASARHDAVLPRKREQLAAVKRWFYHDWRRID